MPKRRVTILVVDDEDDVREMIAVGLSLDGYRVVTASGGEDAIDLCRAESVDVLVTDFKMPGMNGVETVSRVREIVPDIPVIVVTGYLTPSTEKQCMELDGVEFIRKPFEFRVLAAAVQSAVRAA